MNFQKIIDVMKLRMKLRKLRRSKKLVNKEIFFYEGEKDTYNFQKLETIRSFAINIFSF